MGEFAPGTYPPAEEPPPENAFDVESFTQQILGVLQEQGFAPKADAEGHLTQASVFDSEKAALFFRILGHLAKDLPEILQKCVQGGAEIWMPVLKALVTLATGLLKPGMDVLGVLTHEYVTQVAGQGLEKSPAGLSVPGGPAKDATGFVFDQIMAPLLGLLTPSSPGRVGAGEENAQHILGTIISLHLSTWMVNILSNLTGLGFLKWINSFDDAITAGISARGFSRMATRPYLDKFVVTPAARDLNLRYPLEIGSVAGLLKRYVRGNMAPEELKAALRGKGYDDETVADLLLDALKLFSVDDLVYLMDEGLYDWTDAVDALKQQGYPEMVAKTKLAKPYYDLVDAQYRSLASSLVAATIDRRLDTETLRYLLSKMVFSQEEINAMVARAATLVELNTRLSLAQVRELYSEGVEDLAFVQSFLESEGYSYEDRDRLVLLYFTKKEERDAAKAAQADARRNRATAQAAQDKATLAAQQTEALLLG
jgi:hypothetical protein